MLLNSLQCQASLHNKELPAKNASGAEVEMYSMNIGLSLHLFRSFIFPAMLYNFQCTSLRLLLHLFLKYFILSDATGILKFSFLDGLSLTHRNIIEFCILILNPEALLN